MALKKLNNLNNIRKSAQAAISGSLDQALLGLQHSGLSRLAANLKEVPGAAESVDLVSRIGQTVLNRAASVRSQLVATVRAAKPNQKRTTKVSAAKKSSAKAE